MNARRDTPSSDAGFTMIEVLVAAVLLIIGSLATLSLLDSGAKATAASRQRDVAVSLVQEITERAQGGQYTETTNGMTDVVASAGPADRLRAALEPGNDAASTVVSPPTVINGGTPLDVAQSWSLTRRNTTFKVSYRACTLSDIYRGVQIAGPFDCDRTTIPPGNPPGTATNCGVGLAATGQVNLSDPNTLAVRLQLLSSLGLNVCLGSALPALSQALCSAIGNTHALDGLVGSLLGSGGSLAGVLGGLGVGASVGVCPATQLDQALAGASSSVGSATRLAVSVTWTDFKGKQQTLAQTALVRRASS